MSALKVALTWVGLGLVALVTAVVLVACGASAPRATEAPSAAAAGVDADLGRDEGPRAEILRLENESEEMAGKLGVSSHGNDSHDEGSDPCGMPTMAGTTGGDTKVCQGRTAPACSDTCRLADAICDNSESICRLADDLANDWARGRCENGKGTCTRARARCCGCS